MPFQTVDGIVERLRVFHRQLGLCYERTAQLQSDQRIALLLQNMSRHESELERCLAKFGRDGEAAIRATWIQYVPEENVQRTIDETEFGPEMAAEEVVRRALELDAALIDLYRGLATSQAAPRVCELFRHLLAAEETKGKDLSKSVAEIVEEDRG